MKDLFQITPQEIESAFQVGEISMQQMDSVGGAPYVQTLGENSAVKAAAQRVFERIMSSQMHSMAETGVVKMGLSPIDFITASLAYGFLAGRFFERGKEVDAIFGVKESAAGWEPCRCNHGALRNAIGSPNGGFLCYCANCGGEVPEEAVKRYGYVKVTLRQVEEFRTSLLRKLKKMDAPAPMRDEVVVDVGPLDLSTPAGKEELKNVLENLAGAKPAKIRKPRKPREDGDGSGGEKSPSS